MYRVLGGSRTIPCVGTRDDDARARTNAESPGNSDGSGQPPDRPPTPVGAKASDLI
jgi:hypothetical protein